MNLNSQQNNYKRTSIDLNMVANSTLSTNSRRRHSLQYSQQNDELSTSSCKTPSEHSHIEQKIPKDLPKHKFLKNEKQLNKNEKKLMNATNQISKNKLNNTSKNVLQLNLHQQNLFDLRKQSALTIASNQSITPIYSHHNPIQSDPSAFYFHSHSNSPRGSSCANTMSCSIPQSKEYPQQIQRPSQTDKSSTSHSRNQSYLSETKTTPYEIENYINDQITTSRQSHQQDDDFIKQPYKRAQIVVEDDQQQVIQNHTFSQTSSLPMSNFQQCSYKNSHKSIDSSNNNNLTHIQGESLSSIEQNGSKGLAGNSSYEPTSFFLCQSTGNNTNAINQLHLEQSIGQAQNQVMRQQYEKFLADQEVKQCNFQDYYQNQQESTQISQLQDPSLMQGTYIALPLTNYAHSGINQQQQLHLISKTPSFHSTTSNISHNQQINQGSLTKYPYNGRLQSNTAPLQRQSEFDNQTQSSQEEQSIISQSMPCQCTQCLQAQMAYLQQLLIQQQQIYLSQALKDQESESVMSRSSSQMTNKNNTSLYAHPKPPNLEQSRQSNQSDENSESIPEELQTLSGTEEIDQNECNNKLSQEYLQYQQYIQQELVDQDPQIHNYYIQQQLTNSSQMNKNNCNTANPQQNILKKNYIELPLGEIPEMKESFYEEQSRYTNSSLSKQFQSSQFGSLVDYHPLQGAQFMSAAKSGALQHLQSSSKKQQSFCIPQSEEKQLQSANNEKNTENDIQNQNHPKQHVRTSSFQKHQQTTQFVGQNDIYSSYSQSIITPRKQRQLSGSNWGTTIIKQINGTPINQPSLDQQVPTNSITKENELYHGVEIVTQNDFPPFVNSQMLQVNSQTFCPDQQHQQLMDLIKIQGSLHSNQSMLIQELAPIIDNKNDIKAHQRNQSDAGCQLNNQLLNTQEQPGIHDFYRKKDESYNEKLIDNQLIEEIAQQCFEYERANEAMIFCQNSHQQQIEQFPQTDLTPGASFNQANNQVIFYTECDSLENDQFQTSSSKKQTDLSKTLNSYEKDKTDKIISYILDNDQTYQQSAKRQGYRNSSFNNRHSHQYKCNLENSLKKYTHAFQSAEDNKSVATFLTKQTRAVSLFNPTLENTSERNNAYERKYVDETIQTDDLNKVVRWNDLQLSSKKNTSILYQKILAKEQRCRSVESKTQRKFSKYKATNHFNSNLKITGAQKDKAMRYSSVPCSKKAKGCQQQISQKRNSKYEKPILKQRPTQRASKAIKDLTPSRTLYMPTYSSRNRESQKYSQKQQPRQVRKIQIPTTPKQYSENEPIIVKVTNSNTKIHNIRNEKIVASEKNSRNGNANKKKFSKTLFEMSELPSMSLIQRSISVKRQKDQLIVKLAKRKSSVQSNKLKAAEICTMTSKKYGKDEKLNNDISQQATKSKEKGKNNEILISTDNERSKSPCSQTKRSTSRPKHVVINIKRSPNHTANFSVENQQDQSKLIATPQVMVIEEEKSYQQSSSLRGSELSKNPFCNSNLESFRETILCGSLHTSRPSNDVHIIQCKDQKQITQNMKEFIISEFEKMHTKDIQNQNATEVISNQTDSQYSPLNLGKEDNQDPINNEDLLQLQNNFSPEDKEEIFQKLKDYYLKKEFQANKQIPHEGQIVKRDDNDFTDNERKKLSQILTQLDNSTSIARSRQSLNKQVNSFNTAEQKDFLSFNSQRPPSNMKQGPQAINDSLQNSNPTIESQKNLIQTPISKESSKSKSQCEQRSDLSQKENKGLCCSSPSIQKKKCQQSVKKQSFCLPNSMFFSKNHEDLRQSMDHSRTSEARIMRNSSDYSPPNMSTKHSQRDIFQTKSNKNEASVIIQSFGLDQVVASTFDQRKQSQLPPRKQSRNEENTFSVYSDGQISSQSQQEKQKETVKSQCRVLKLSKNEKDILRERVIQHKNNSLRRQTPTQYK